MTLLIDGHNLIGAGVFADIRLDDEDDEAKLVARLKVWRSRIRHKIVVFFDRGIPGGRDHRMSGGGVEVVFAANPTEADDLIRRRLQRAGRHTVLVTNDDALAREASAYGVERWRGHEFTARMAIQMPDLPSPEPGEEWDVRLTPAEVEEWLEVFRTARRARRLAAKSHPGDAGSMRKARGMQSRRAAGRASGKTSRNGVAPGKPPKQPKSADSRPPKPKLPKQSQRKARQAVRGNKRSNLGSG